MLVPLPITKLASYSKFKDGFIKTREYKSLIVRGLLYLTYLLDLELDLSFLFDFLKHETVVSVSVAPCCSSLLSELLYKMPQL